MHCNVVLRIELTWRWNEPYIVLFPIGESNWNIIHFSWQVSAEEARRARNNRLRRLREILNERKVFFRRLKRLNEKKEEENRNLSRALSLLGNKYNNIRNILFYPYMLRLWHLASILEVLNTLVVTLFVLIYTCLNNNNQYEAW